VTAALVLAIGLLPVRAVVAKIEHRPVTWRTFVGLPWSPLPLRTEREWWRAR